MNLIATQVHSLISIMLLVVAAVGCERMEGVVSGAGSAAENLANKIAGDKSSKQDKGGAEEQAYSQSASGKIGEPGSDPAEDSGGGEVSEAEPEPVITGPRTGDFHLVFEMSYQSCSSCGVWFDSAKLVIVHSQGRFTAQQTGSLLIKEAPYFQGRFNANISSIPPASTILSATLYLHLNAAEGISNDDFTSSISVYGDVGGSKRYIKEITAQNDIKGRGYSKANPVVPIDFTNYAKQI